MEQITAFAVIAVCSALFMLYLMQHRLANLLLAAFLIRLGGALIGRFAVKLLGSGADAVRFEEAAAEIASSGMHGIIESFATGSDFYPWISSFPYYFLGREPLLLQFINVILGTLIVMNTYKICRVAGATEHNSVRAAWGAALFPTLINFSVVTLREGYIVYFLMLSIYYMMRWQKEGPMIFFFMSLGAIALAGAFHAGILLVLAFVPLYFVYLAGKGLAGASGVRMTTLVLALGMSFVLFYLVYSYQWNTGKIVNKVEALEGGGVSEAFDVSRRSEAARATYMREFSPDSPQELVLSIPLRVFLFLFSPLPYQITEAKDILGVIDSTLYLVLTYFIIKNRRQLRKNRFSMILIGFILTGVVVFAMGTVNYGTAIRHRAKFVPLIICLAAMSGLLRLWPLRENREHLSLFLRPP